MSAADWIITAIVLVLLALAIIYIVRQKKKGKCIGCGGDCSDCIYRDKKGNGKKK